MILEFYKVRIRSDTFERLETNLLGAQMDSIADTSIPLGDFETGCKTEEVGI